MNRLGASLTFEELNKMFCDLDPQNRGFITFDSFLSLYRQLKHQDEDDDDDQDTLDAYVAVGGSQDKSGNVNASILIKIIKEQFQLSIDIERLIKEVDDS